MTWAKLIQNTLDYIEEHSDECQIIPGEKINGTAD